MSANHPKRLRWKAANIGGWTALAILLAVPGIDPVRPPARAATLDAPAATVAPATAVPDTQPWTRQDAAHLLRRAGFGGTPEQIDRLFAMGRDGAVDYLLTGQAPKDSAPVFAAVKLEDFKPIAEPPPDPALIKEAQLARAARHSFKQRLANGPAPTTAPSTSAAALVAPTTAPAVPAINPAFAESQVAAKKIQKQAKQNGRENIEQLRAWWVDRMVRTDRPLEEKMTLFWHGLFTSGVQEVKNPNFIEQQIALFHREALGNYKQLTDDVIHGGAMLKYLNNDQNIKGKPNENLAREMMELFTMGEGKGYTETDIKEIARALTGLAPFGGKRYGEGTVYLSPRAHDSGNKTIFGQTGNFGPDDVVKLIFTRPEPARYLAKKLWEFYAYPDPSDADIAPVVIALEQSGYELKPALRALFTSPAFYGDKAQFALIKSPTELAIEELRTLGMTPSGGEDLAVERQIKAMDQELLQPPNVRGWVGGDNWITAATLYTRYNTSSAMVNGALRFNGGGGKGNPNRVHPNRDRGGRNLDGGPNAVDLAKLFSPLGKTPAPAQVVDAAVDRFLQRPLSAEKRSALLDALGPESIQLGDSASDTRVRQMICLLMSTPEYQVH